MGIRMDKGQRNKNRQMRNDPRMYSNFRYDRDGISDQCGIDGLFNKNVGGNVY